MKPKSELLGNRISAAGSSQACVSTLWGLCLVFCILLSLCVCLSLSLCLRSSTISVLTFKAQESYMLRRERGLNRLSMGWASAQVALAHRVHLCNLEKADAAHPPFSLYRTQPTQRCMAAPVYCWSTQPWLGCEQAESHGHPKHVGGETPHTRNKTALGLSTPLLSGRSGYRGANQFCAGTSHEAT